MNGSYTGNKMQSHPVQVAAKAESTNPKPAPVAKPKQGSQPDHHVTNSTNHTKTLSQSEKNFLAGQALKERIAKKTGVYPNTAN